MKCKITYMNILFFFFALSGYFSSCQVLIDFSDNEGESQIYKSLQVDTNREEGVAPLSVSFDLTNTEFFNDDDLMLAEFMWDFGDEGDEYNVGKGYCPSHVYRKPGNYTATVTAYYLGEELGSRSVDIEVSEFNGDTYYISCDGSDDTGDGSIDNPFASLEYASENFYAPNTRFLLRQGDIFLQSSRILFGAFNGVIVQGPVHISSYRDPENPSDEKPIINDTRVNAGLTSTLCMLNCDDFRVENIKFILAGGNVNNRDLTAQYPTGIGMSVNAPCTNCLLLDCDVQGAGTHSIKPEGNYIVVQDCTVRDAGMYGVYMAEGYNCAFIGMDMRNFTKDNPQYSMRLSTHIVKNYLAYNDFRADYTNNTLQIRGNDTSYNYVWKNQFDRAAGINQTNNEENETLHHNTFDSNIIVARDYEGNIPAAWNSRGWRFGSNTSMARNNIIYGFYSPFYILTHDIVGGSKKLWFHNNTAISLNENSYFIGIRKSCKDIELKNNVFYNLAESLGYADGFISVQASYPEIPTDLTQIDSDFNIFQGEAWDTDLSIVNVAYYSPDLTIEMWQNEYTNEKSSSICDALLNTVIDLDDVTGSLEAGFARLKSGSPAMNAGDPSTIYTLFDFFGNERSSLTIGAIGE